MSVSLAFCFFRHISASVLEAASLQLQSLPLPVHWGAAPARAARVACHVLHTCNDGGASPCDCDTVMRLLMKQDDYCDNKAVKMHR